ncbi:hypothetical protein K458DRAFT_386399 [Lentithecium fluviatile CBS 122367]|uniref:Uncharacterized protein n=1 Tax=Lentithecium fluviatile CBS 122367 TaxID=1168545 RepID=A0A6G1JBR9_9PLEO|nr:hypothetical protein K458DRAFT_386399 [Lentithecium fluviatile CBS 122367]
MLSVFISWTCNRHSIVRDTIGNDLLATLIIPSIAAIHCHIELGKIDVNEPETDLETLDATLVVVGWFTVCGLWLLGLATGSGRPKKCFFIGAVLVLCASALFTISTRRDLPTRLPAAEGLNWFIMGLTTALFSILLPLIIPTNKTARDAVAALFAGARDNSYQPRAYSALRLAAMHLLFLTTWLLMVVADGVLFSRLPDHEEGKPDRPEHVVPQTSYSITELDQAVALCAGILTVMFTMYEALNSWRFTAWENYRRWRSSCEILLEEDVLETNEAERWKTKLRIMAEREKEMLNAPVKTDILARMERNKKWREEQKERADEEKYRRGEMSREEELAFSLERSGFL